MDAVHLDTHVVAWLYAGRVELLSRRAARAIETNRPAVCPMVVLELGYLREIGRLTVDAHAILGDLGARLGLIVEDLPMRDAVQAALDLVWTRDPFDRLIVGAATALDRRLVTRDTAIRRQTNIALW